MKNHIKLMKRIKSIIPPHIQPKFKNEKDLLLWNKKKGLLFSKSILIRNKAMKIQKTLEESGIKDLYLNCSFKNYKVFHSGQEKALNSSKKYVKNFNKELSNFIFSGKPGTGKNHLAAAIGNHLILHGKKILIITIADLMSKIKKTFQKNNNFTEEYFINKTSTVDLLIIDEIGIQKESNYEKIIIHQIIDRRSASKKSTGMLSNLNYNSLHQLLGERILDRMKLGNSIWLNFNWKSYRSYVSVKKK
ncbi:DNA replication protein DnaC [Buchnera aphidicola]|uniref:DNA replication protein DnaC n=1 Tax=Buchnera aphidicola TaxID=9 RepID=UPI0020929A2A|nr:DNA replication protein DnaC [Buchnera aphidicola]USS94155.1 DNA replication protein DnaC [Buchnera aphidicola (Sipha maydis)]WII23703.1 DNA replication protein DnaC [Buchnera aphidicola (Sipha maydis)]